MPKIGCDFPMPDIAKHFDTTMQKKTGKTNSAVFRNLSGLHFQYILNGLPLFYDNKGKDVRNPFSPPRSQLIFPRSCGKGISMQQHRMQHCRHIWYFSQYTLSWNLTFARSRRKEAFQYKTRSESIFKNKSEQSGTAKITNDIKIVRRPSNDCCSKRGRLLLLLTASEYNCSFCTSGG